MQCNQSFCGHGFNNVPFFSCNNAPIQCNPNIYSDLVGEGIVTSLTLPDGSIQLFFKPTLKWWTPNTYQPNIPTPMNPMMQTNVNYSIPYCNNPLGTWFVRSINNPLPPNCLSPPFQQFDPTKLCNSECNINCNNGYQIKFHNDHSTSTTDMQYFYPCLRQFEYTFKSPCRGSVAVQVDSPPCEQKPVCNYDVRCICHKPMSIVSIAEPKRKRRSYTPSPSSSCEDTRKKRSKRSKKHTNKRHKSKSKKVKCECESTEHIPTADKLITTYTDNGSSCSAMNVCETQTTPERNKQSCSKRKPILLTNSCVQRCDDNEDFSWHHVSPTSVTSPVCERDRRKDSVDELFNFSENEYMDSDDDFSSTTSCCGS